MPPSPSARSRCAAVQFVLTARRERCPIPRYPRCRRSSRLVTVLKPAEVAAVLDRLARSLREREAVFPLSTRRVLCISGEHAIRWRLVAGLGSRAERIDSSQRAVQYGILERWMLCAP